MVVPEPSTRNSMVTNELLSQPLLGGPDAARPDGIQ